jgi:hypothetical protein
MTPLTPRQNSFLNNTDVLGYIQAQNAARNAQAKAEGWQFWTLMAEQLAEEHANVYELELRLTRGDYSDVHKEWSGCRPHSNYSRMSIAEMEGEIAWMSEMAAAAYQEELEWVAEQDKLMRDEVAMGIREPAEEDELEQWEVYEAAAEAEGY